jgi:protein-tyrosine phosphatase
MDKTTQQRPTSILFVCMGNICRSPTAEGVFRHEVRHHRLTDRFLIDSAGTHGYHVGSPPDDRAIAHAAKRGYDLRQLRARPVTAEDFDNFDIILAMDHTNLRHLKTLAPSRCHHKLELLMHYGHQHSDEEVPDPYQGGSKDFEHALNLIEDGCRGLIEFLMQRHAARS